MHDDDASPEPPERSLDDPESLEGATPEEIDELARRAGWTDEPTRSGDGMRWRNPATKGADQVRHHAGKRNDPNPVKRGPYARVTRPGIKYPHPIPLKRNPTLKLASEVRVKAAEREILELATEDYQGLWEVRSQVEETLGQRGRRVQGMVGQAVHNLLGRGWVRLFRASSQRWNEATPLTEAEAAAVLSDPGAWEPPRSDSGQLLIAATPEGERAYMSRALDEG